MTPPANGQADSAPKHSSPNDLTKFVTPDPAWTYAVASGGYGSVYKCIYKEGEQSKHVAVKVIHGRSDTDDEALWREIGIWKRMRHKCIVPLLGTTAHDSRVSFVSLWMPNGTLYSYLKKVEGSLAVKYSLLYNVADGLHYLHSESVVHGDLTSNNVLINGEGQACLVDFGLSSMMKIGERFEYLRQDEKRPGAVHWAAPELIPDISSDNCSVNKDEKRYMPSTSSDIYSYGCIMYEVLSGGDIPCKHRNHIYCVTEKLHGVSPERPESKDMQDEDWIFILQCWLSLPSLRPFASQALKFARSRCNFVSSDHAESCETSNCASIYSAHLDGANVYNLSSLIRSHPQPAFSNPATCWMSIDKLAEALIGLFTTKQNQHGLIDAMQLYHVSLATLAPSTTFISSSLRKIASAIAQIGTEQSDVEVRDTIERTIGLLGDGNPLHFRGLSYLCLHGIADHITKANPYIIYRVKDWYKKSFGNIHIAPVRVEVMHYLW